MTDEEKKQDQEVVALGPLNIKLSRENMKLIMPFVGWSLIILTAASVVGAIVWGIK